MSRKFELRLPIPFVDDFARSCFANAFSDTFSGFEGERVKDLSEGRFFTIIEEGPMKAVAWWLKARGIKMKIVKIHETEVTLKELGFLEV